MRRTGRKSSRSRSRRDRQQRQLYHDVSERMRAPRPETGAVPRTCQKNQSVPQTSHKQRHASFADEVQIHLIPRAWETPDVYFTVPENTCSPYIQPDQENLVRQNPQRKLFPDSKKKPLQTHTPSSYETYVDDPESPPFRIVAVPVEVDEETARRLPPLGIVYEYDPAPSWMAFQYQYESPDNESISRTRRYRPRPGLATPWERNEERSRRREKRYLSQRGSPVSPDEYVPPLENWFRTPGYVITDILRKQRESHEDPENECYDETSTAGTPVSSDAENRGQNLNGGQTFTIYVDKNTTSDNDESSDTDTYDGDEAKRSEVVDDKLENENYEYNRKKFQAIIGKNSEPFKIYSDSPNSKSNGGNKNVFTIYTESSEKPLAANSKSNGGNKSAFTIYTDSPKKPAETVVPVVVQQANGENGSTVYRDSPKRAETVVPVPQQVNTRPLVDGGVSEDNTLNREKIDKIMNCLDLQDYIERKSFYRHLKKVQEIRRNRIFNTLMGIDCQSKPSTKNCVEGQEQLGVEDDSGSSVDDTDGSYYLPGYGTPAASKNIKKKL